LLIFHKAGTAGGARVIQNLKSVSYKAGNSSLTFFDHGLENFGFSTKTQVCAGPSAC